MLKKLATWEGRRTLTDNDQASPQTLKEAAAALMAADLLSDAIVFAQRAGDDDALLQIVDLAVKEGNFFLLKEAASKLKVAQINRNHLLDLITAAKTKGQFLYQAQAEQYLSENF
ncbi:MAG: hypothetical protein ACRCTY_10605 [Candidatus Adiutrix sp.]